MKKLTKQSLVAALIALTMPTLALADGGDEGGRKGCSVATLDGLYVFSATGYIIPASGPAQPKAIVEWIRFNGDGTLSVPGATRSLNGVIAQTPPGGTGIYTVADIVPAGGGCSGTLTFAGGPSFDLFISPKAGEIAMIQTNSGNVFQGTAVMVSR